MPFAFADVDRVCIRCIEISSTSILKAVRSWALRMSVEFRGCICLKDY